MSPFSCLTKYRVLFCILVCPSALPTHFLFSVLARLLEWEDGLFTKGNGREGKKRKQGKGNGGARYLGGSRGCKRGVFEVQNLFGFSEKSNDVVSRCLFFYRSRKKKFQRAQNSEQRFIWVAFCLVYGIVGGACAVYDGSRAYFWWVLSGWGPDSIELGWSVFLFVSYI